MERLKTPKACISGGGLDPKDAEEDAAGWWGCVEIGGKVHEEEPGGGGHTEWERQGYWGRDDPEFEFGYGLHNGRERVGTATILEAAYIGRTLVHGAVRCHLAHSHAAGRSAGNAGGNRHAAVEAGEGGLGDEQGCQEGDRNWEGALHSLKWRLGRLGWGGYDAGHNTNPR